MEKNSAANLLTSIDSLFTTQQERDLATQPRVEEISLDLIDDFPDHPFKVRMDESMPRLPLPMRCDREKSRSRKWTAVENL